MRILSVALLFASTAAFAAPTMPWKATHQWTPSLEKKFSDFVATIGNSGCRSLTECLTSPAANPAYAAKTPKVRFFADCAKLPYALRMYFAWAEGLPFDYVSGVTPANPAGETGSDDRYTKFGNKPAGRRAVAMGASTDFIAEYARMRDSVSTATYRMHYNEVSDFFPPVLDLANIRPGTVVYDPSGHAAIIYKIESDGRIRMIDAHPDNSITHITYDQKFIRSRAAHGAGFKNWRPELDVRPTAEMPGFSVEEFQSKFVLNGVPADYYDYVRGKMAGGALRFEPVNEVQNMVSEICSNLHDREASVTAAIKVGIQNQQHPDRLPENIFGTSGEWEEFSSPSRDARLKVAYVELRQQTERFVKMYQAGDARIVYTPAASRYSGSCRPADKTCFLAASLMSAFEQSAGTAACQFAYTDSRGDQRKLSYHDVQERLFAMSFDPYHCAELRWGETGAGLSSCQDDRYKMQWYAAEQKLRNQTERTYDVRMDLDVNNTARSLGVEQAPDVDIWDYLAALVGAPQS
jgi:hypothetical protein